MDDPNLLFMLRGIITIYLLLFVTALTCSGYYLKGIILMRPIPMIGLLKYLLLCVLFVILAVNAVKAMTLKPRHIHRFSESTKNFKWLFTIAIVISLAAKTGFFHTALQKHAAVTDVQTGILLILAIFCFRSDAVLNKINSSAEVEPAATHHPSSPE
jgi:hypothetical protein